MEEDLFETLQEEGLQYERVHQPIFRKDRHLSSALTDTEISYMLSNRNNPKGLKREHRELLEHVERVNATILNSKSFIPWIANEWTNLSSTSESLAGLTTALQVASEALRVSILDYMGLSHCLHIKPTRELALLYHAKCGFNKVIKDITYQTLFHQSYTIGLYKGDAYGNLHLVWQNTTTCWLITHSHFVAARDMINSWFDAYLYGLVARNKYPGYDFYEEINSVIQAGRELLVEREGEAYALIKLWPSLVISCILRDTENKTDFYKTLEDALPTYKPSRFYRLATRTICTDICAHMALELTGLWKCFGHPEVNMEKSVNTWIKKGSVSKGPCKPIAEILVWTFRLEFCRQYYRRHKRWPVVRLGMNVPYKIKRDYVNNQWSERPTVPWKSEEFEHVHLEKNLDFDYHIDMTDLLSDKSIIPSREQWIHEYDKQAHRTQWGRFPTGPPPTSKSVVVHYLKQDRITVKEVIDKLQDGNLPFSWRVMVAVPKEREFKDEDARFYGKMCFEMRLYQTSTEKNIADGVFTYIKHQSMTMSEEQLIRTILRMNTPIIHLEGETYVFIVLDFSSWCTNFRYELITPLFEELDNLYGLNGVFSLTHLFPLISVLLFQDRFNPPRQKTNGDPEEGPRCYYAPEAWLEGQRQKGWTLATILIILLASWKCGTSASLLGQGDNQVILLRIPPHDHLRQQGLEMDTYVKHYLSVLKDLCEEAQIVIKLEETWYSRNLFEYSRKYHYKGSQVSCCCKRITRLASEANQVIPSLNSDIAGMFSTGTAAAAEDSTPMAAYYCTIVEAALHLWDSNPWMKKEPWEYTCCLLLLTRSLGGYPVTIYSQFCTRAVQDTLSTNLHLVRTVLNDNTLKRQMRRVVTLTPGQHRDFLSLIKDPQSIPLDVPLQPENYIKREIKKGLMSLIVNQDVKQLFTLNTDVAHDDLVKDLSAVVPCNPKLLNKLYSLSNIGLQEKWTSMFANTRSIQQVAFRSWSDEADVIRAVHNLEKQYERYLQNKSEDLLCDELKSTGCVSTYTQLLREKAWNTQMEGITMPPQQEQIKVKRWDQLTGDQSTRSILVTSQETSAHKQTSRGRYTPYFGSLTQLRAKRATLQVVEVGSMVSSIKQLMELHGWVKGNDQLTELIETLIKEKTNISIEELQKYTKKVYSGAIAHRLPCPALKRGGMANQNLNHSSFFTITSDTALEYAKGGINYAICFQSCFLYGLTVLAHYTELGIPIARSMALTFDCVCTWRIPPESFTLPTVSYKGVQTGVIIDQLRHKDVYERYPLHQQVDEHLSYAVITARKFAAWIVNRRTIDKITSLDNRTMEENLTLTFVNLAEFSRLQVPLFLNSFIFYCILFDPLYFGTKYDYFNEILEGAVKNPYDLLIDSFKRCGHMQALGRLHGGPTKAYYNTEECRTLLYNIITKLCEDYRRILTTAYILTPEDKLPVLIRAIQAWLALNELPSILDVSMSREDLDEHLRTTYRHYPSIIPVCTLSEEETTLLIRAAPIQRVVEKKGLLPYPYIDELRTGPIIYPTPALPYLYLVNECPYASALLELCESAGLLEHATGKTLVTIGDQEGVYYAILSHSWAYKEGYPYWSNNQSWERDPYALMNDRCTLPWSRLLYLANGPKEVPCIPPNSIVLLAEDKPLTAPPETIYLQRIRGGQDFYEAICTMRCYVHQYSDEVWVLHKKQGQTFYPREHSNIPFLKSVPQTLASLSEVLNVALHGPSCFSPFADVAHLLGQLPDKGLDFVLLLKSRVAKAIHVLSARCIRATTYEGAIEVMRHKARYAATIKKIATYHYLYRVFTTAPWFAVSSNTVVPYHIHRRGAGVVLCWRSCGVESQPINMGDIHKVHFYSYARYCWILLRTDTSEVPTMKCPRIVFTYTSD
ncbi:RNA-dependent RNA polymerase [Formica exsecta virus 4]|uniref:RNA-directed RNA polymerase n=1 Tax=Formica exsecta virus 4 TaxID=2306079 RepID=A0A3B1EJ88_9MONO|nr:RNA-dependent RNA polymerase [Formica exsecta virus 4]AWI42881.1 RNA-dependent RNA polymerase [Formica exsecta virus 4]